jgi:hypothetical protein
MVNTSEVRFYARWGSALCLARESGAAARRRCSAPGLRTLRQGAWAAARPPLQRARTSDSAAGGFAPAPLRCAHRTPPPAAYAWSASVAVPMTCA